MSDLQQCNGCKSFDHCWLTREHVYLCDYCFRAWKLRRQREQDELVYDAQHETLGCKVTHMIGIPLMLLAPVVAVFMWKLGLIVMAAGIGLQFIGHLVHEQNFPALINSDDPLRTIEIGVKKCAQWWKQLLTTGTLIALLFFPPAAEAKLWLPLRVVRAVALVPFRVPGYCKDVLEAWKQEIYNHQKLKMSRRLFTPLFRAEPPEIKLERALYMKDVI